VNIGPSKILPLENHGATIMSTGSDVLSTKLYVSEVTVGPAPDVGGHTATASALND